MTTEAGFAQALRENPHDDETRLIFADWLDDRDDARGEFLRVQLELARWVPDYDQRQALFRRCEQLLAQHEAAWLGPLQELSTEVVWDRGLPHITLTADRLLAQEFVASGQQLLDRALVGSVRILGDPDARDALVRSALLDAMPHLYLERLGLEDHHVAELASNPFFRGVRTLSLATNRITEAGVSRLLASPGAASLTQLDLRNNRLRDNAVWELLAWDAPHLADLRLQGNPLGPVALDALTAWRRERLGPGRFVNSLGMEFVWIPPGTYLRGSDDRDRDRYDDEGPRWRTTISHGFYLGMLQVTQAEYLRVVGENPARFHAGNNGGLNHPVEMVSWTEAGAFCARLGTLPGEVGRRYRLPTESEWEHAARAGWDHTALPWGRTPAAWLANYGNALGHTVPAGSYPPTPWGLYDLSGNLWDWCADWHDDYPQNLDEPVVDPQGPESGEQRVLRGGSWYGPPRNVRCACRGNDSPTTHDHYFGFRVVCAGQESGANA